jgi:hypothetical protein
MAGGFGWLDSWHFTNAVLAVAMIAAYLGGKDANVNVELPKAPATGEN